MTETRALPGVVLDSVLTCPVCGHAQREVMPVDACIVSYTCDACRTELRPLAGTCCVFCSYGSVACPPVQTHDACCAPARGPDER